MLLVTILIGALLLVPVYPETHRLGYNPNYDVWYFVPPTPIENLTPGVMRAYFEHNKKGGICFKDHVYIFCKTGVKIE
ncbi:uncharacterized protein DMAD_08155 [Drosophila madeirensis]|uniref:Uncharacterized protein n=1 Tax=Drosophila madeirensis TaxID=30013 RepID=A0AAU9ES91_DROMD|nr:uncharacterized protein LOC117896745 [Drosophila subobscura]